MNIKEIQEVVKMMQENDIVEFQLERNGFKILLKRVKTQGEGSVQPAQITLQSTPVSKESEQKERAQKYIEIVSPMVGTFYAAPSPESASYVQPGQQIHVGDVVCIVEAMKVMNEIKSEVNGTVSECLVESGQPIEYGQILFKLNP